jgi:hypothetical protein
MLITYDWIQRNSTSQKVGSWNKAQLKAIGAWPPKKGWVFRMIGQEITEPQQREFESHGYLNKSEEQGTLI